MQIDQLNVAIIASKPDTAVYALTTLFIGRTVSIFTLWANERCGLLHADLVLNLCICLTR